MRNDRARPQKCWKSCANGSNIVTLRFGDHGTKEMLRVVGWKVWPVSNFAQQHAPTCNRVCKRTQHVTSNNFGSCWPTMLLPFARGLTLEIECARQFSIDMTNWLIFFFSRQIHGNLGSSVAVGSEIIEPEEWHHLVYRYDAQSK